MAEEYRNKTKKYYASISAKQSANTSLWRWDLIKKYNSAEKSVIDLGCGTGNYLLKLPNKKITGIDLSKESISVLKKRPEYIKNKSKIRVTVGDLTKTMLKNGEFDFGFSFSTLYYIKEIDLLIAELSRIVKKNAILILEFGNKYSINSIWDRLMFPVPQFHWSKSRIIRELKRNGFEIIEIKYRQIIPDFFKKFDKDFIKSRLLQKIAFRLIFIVRKKK